MPANDVNNTSHPTGWFLHFVKKPQNIIIAIVQINEDYLKYVIFS
jgi:hypothetical protein